MSQLLLDELFDDEVDQQQQVQQQNDHEQQKWSELGADGKVAQSTSEHLGAEKISLQAAISTPSLSESNASTTLLCRPERKEQHLSLDVIPPLEKQQSAESSDVGACADGYSCNVYYDALEEQLVEKSSSSKNPRQIGSTNTEEESGHFLTNPIFCEEEAEDEEIKGRKSKYSRLDIEEDSLSATVKEDEAETVEDSSESEDDLPLDIAGLAASSRQNLLTPKLATKSSVKRKQQKQSKKQQQPHLSVSSFSSCSSSPQQPPQPASSHSPPHKSNPHPPTLGATKKRQRAAAGSSEMRLLGGNGNGGRQQSSQQPQQSTSVAPMTSGGITDGPLDSGMSGTAVAAPSGKRVQAKQNQMYLITTLLPGSSSNQQNGGNSPQQNGHTHQNGGGHHAHHQQHQPIPVALINRMLPTELILRVFSYLDITSLGRCAQVCRSWNKLAMDGSNWMDVDLFQFQREVKTSVVESLAKRCGNFLKGLSLKGCENVQDNAMRSFATKCPNIERLTLSKCKLVTDATCEYIGRYCHRIVMIDLENCTLITDIAMKFIGEGCKRLEELNISWCEQITDLGIAYIAKSCTNLRTLFCKGLDNITANCFAQLDMQELRSLSLLSCPNVLDDTVNDITKRCHRLEFLSLSNCKEITDQALICIAQGCPRLKDIELAGCQNLTDAGFIQLSKNCHELERMDMEECSMITDTTLSNLNNGCPNLYSLSLSHCENLTDNGLAELCAAHKERLQVLELDNCPNITDHTLESMKMLKVLERVDLYDCQMITKEAIKKFKQSRPEVEVHAYFAPATPPPQAPPVRRGICRCCAIL